MLSLLEDLGQVDNTVANEVVLLGIFVQTCHIQRLGVFGVRLVHENVDLWGSKMKGGMS